jgi:hypothetical protein
VITVVLEETVVPRGVGPATSRASVRRGRPSAAGLVRATRPRDVLASFLRPRGWSVPVTRRPHRTGGIGPAARMPHVDSRWQGVEPVGTFRASHGS